MLDVGIAIKRSQFRLSVEALLCSNSGLVHSLVLHDSVRVISQIITIMEGDAMQQSR